MPAHCRRRRRASRTNTSSIVATLELRLQLRRRAQRRDASVHHDRDAVAVLRLVHVVRRDEHRRPARRRRVDQLPELPARDRVDAAGRLVEEHDLRLVQQRDREGELLLPAERQAAARDRRRSREVERVEQRRRRAR